MNEVPYLLIGSEPPKDYAGFVLEMLEALKKKKIKGIAVVALVAGECDCDCLAAYWNMSVQDKACAASHIQFDAIDGFILANADRYQREAEGEEE